MNTELLDNLSLDKNHPDNLNYASVGARFWASILDGLIVTIPIFGLQFLNLIVLHNIIVQYLTMCIYPFYKIYMEGTFGYTLGKKILKIRVLNLSREDQQMDLKTAILRYSFYFPTFLASLLLTFFTFDPEALQAVTSIIDALMYSSKVTENAPNYVTILNSVSSVITLIALLFVFEGTKKQTLYDRVAKTVCVKI